MNVVRVLPLDLELEVPDGATVMAAAHAAGYIWPTECEANASCGLCVSIVREGLDHCGPMPEDEQETLLRTMGQVEPTRRLACRLNVTGPVTITKRGVRPADEA